MTATPTIEATRAELARQRTILARQERQYEEAKPRSRFAYAAHITKTKSKIARLEQALPLGDTWEHIGYTDAIQGTSVREHVSPTYLADYDRGFARGEAEGV